MSKYDMMRLDQDFIGEQTVDKKVLQGILNARLDNLYLSVPGFYVRSKNESCQVVHETSNPIPLMDTFN